MLGLFFLLLQFEINSSATQDRSILLKVKAFQSLSKFVSKADFPEITDKYLMSKPNTAISFGGGGSRSYVASLGILSALNDLNLMDGIRYVGGVSGGSWAVIIFTYSTLKIDDQVLLGKITPPEMITLSSLQKMNKQCALGFPNRNSDLIFISALRNQLASTIWKAWQYTIQKIYLDPCNILPQHYLSWKDETVQDIIARNPSLAPENFTLPAKMNRPFPIIGTTLIGPSSNVPYTILHQNRNFTKIEITPLYIGQMKTRKVEYGDISHHPNRQNIPLVVGGGVETIGCGQIGNQPEKGLLPNQTQGILLVPKIENKNCIDAQFIMTATSYAPGAVVCAFPQLISYRFGMNYDYWSPTLTINPAAIKRTNRKLIANTSLSTSPQSSTSIYSLLADGGSIENINLISFLQRRVDKIVLFLNPIVPILPFNKWDVYNDPPSESQIDPDLSAYFGVLPLKMSFINTITQDLTKNQVFDKKFWPEVVIALQKAQEKGNGIIASFNFSTIENEWWGIPAGINVELTIMYLGRLASWERRLQPEVYKEIVPKWNADDLSNTVKGGAFSGFPHYATKPASMSYERANLLASLTGWSILENAGLFKDIFS